LLVVPVGVVVAGVVVTDGVVPAVPPPVFDEPAD
jgi:hypothetical protein